jgi:hypothetical protein
MILAKALVVVPVDNSHSFIFIRHTYTQIVLLTTPILGHKQHRNMTFFLSLSSKRERRSERQHDKG